MKKKALGIFLVLSMAAISAEKNIETKIQNENVLTKKIEKNEIDIVTIKKQYSVDLKEIENKYKEKENIIKEKLIDIKNEKDQIKLEKDEIIRNFNSLHSFLNRLFNYSFIGIIVFILSVVGYLISLFKSIDKKIQAEADRKITKQVKEEVKIRVSEIVKYEAEKITEIVKKYDIEERIKQNKKICILSADKEKADELRKVLYDFKKIDYKGIENSNSLDYNEYNMILLNHNNKAVTKETIEKIVEKIKEKNKETLFFYYGKEFLSKDIENINYCKSIFTLYGNLIDLLRTQDLLKK